MNRKSIIKTVIFSLFCTWILSVGKPELSWKELGWLLAFYLLAFHLLYRFGEKFLPQFYGLREEDKTKWERMKKMKKK